MTKKSMIMQMDILTKQQSVMQADHSYIHEGIGYTISLDLGSITTAYHIAIETGANNFVHYRPGSTSISTDADQIEYLLRENITSFTGGSAYTPYNRNRNSTSVSAVTVTTDVTPTLGSPLLLDAQSIGTTGTPNARGGGGAGGSEEIVFKPSTTYLISLTPAGATEVYFNVFWYEELMGV